MYKKVSSTHIDEKETLLSSYRLCEDLGGLGGDDLGDGQGHEPVPLVGLDGAELLAAGAGAAAPEADDVANDVSAGTGLLAQVVAHDGAADAATEVHEQAVRHDGALLSDGGGEQLGGRAQAAEGPESAADDGTLGIGGAAAGSDLPDLVDLSGGTSPVDLVEAKDTLDASGLNLGNAARHVDLTLRFERGKNTFEQLLKNKTKITNNKCEY